jgi:hypothetical protein
MERLIEETKTYCAIALMIVSGFVGGVLVLGLIPGDDINTDVLGSLVLAVPCGIVFWISQRYVNRRVKTARP